MGRTKVIAQRYSIQFALGKGGGGKVFLAFDSLQGNRPVALKLVPLSRKGPSPLIADLKNEFATVCLLKHRNLAQAFDFGITDREMYFTSEWVEGKNLFGAAEQADFNTIFDLLVQTLRAVDFIHRRGVLHLDLKPDNILVTDPDTNELTVKLIDFGIAQWKRRGRMQDPFFFGTPPFAAPEVILEKEPTVASDIYSLGMIFHLILAKRFPFPVQGPIEILQRQTFEDPQALGKFHPALPESLSELLHNMVARDPERRPQSAADVLQALNSCLGENFSLRSLAAPVQILEESDEFFHPELLEALVGKLKNPKPLRLALVGPEGSGKTCLLLRIKAVLQLQGIRSLYVQNAATCPEAFSHAEITKTPVLWDANDGFSLFDWENLNRGEAPFPLLIAANNADEFKLVTDEVWQIPPLKEASLTRFLRDEIRLAPDDLGKQILAARENLLPADVEQILQAFREEALISWTSEGWRWQGELNPELPEVFERHATLWERRKASIRKILETSRLSFPAPTLEGLIGLEAGSLGIQLEAWCEEKWLIGNWENGFRCFRSSGADPIQDLPRGLASDPEWLAAQLKSLYDEGKYSLGVAWAEFLKSERTTSLPPRISIYAARHLVAEGFGQKALDWLPDKLPENPGDLGLLSEIRARAFLLIGRGLEIGQELARAEEAYRSANDLTGLARVFNLRGTVAKNEASWEDAEKHFLEAIQTAESAGDPYCAGTAQTNLALSYQEQGKIDQAYLAYRRAWNHCDNFFHPRLTNVLFHNWINLLSHMGRAKEAEKSCYEWMNLAIRHRYAEQEASALNYLAIFSGQKNQRELQGSFLNQAIGLLDPNKSPRLLAQLLANRSLLYWSLENFTAAERDAHAALKICGRWADDPLLAWIYLVLGKVSRDCPAPDYEQASGYFDLAERNVRKHRARQLLWEVKLNQGKLEKRRGFTEQARGLFLDAIEALEELEKSLPAFFKESYLRDLKLDRVRRELENLEENHSTEELPETETLGVCGN